MGGLVSVFRKTVLRESVHAVRTYVSMFECICWIIDVGVRVCASDTHTYINIHIHIYINTAN